MRSCLLQIAPDGTLPLWSAFVQDGLAIGNVLAMEHEQQVRVGRRLAAIVAADVAGYSRLMGLDEVGTARTLREHRAVTDALVAKHGGRLVKSTGDGVLLEFLGGRCGRVRGRRASGDDPTKRRGAC